MENHVEILRKVTIIKKLDSVVSIFKDRGHLLCSILLGWPGAGRCDYRGKCQGACTQKGSFAQLFSISPRWLCLNMDLMNDVHA